VLAQAQEGLSSIRMVHAFGREQFEVMQFHQQAQPKFAGEFAAHSHQRKQRARDQHSDGAWHRGDVLRRNITRPRRHAHARNTARFQRVSLNALSTPRIDHLHCLGDGRRDCRREDAASKCSIAKTTWLIRQTPSPSNPPKVPSDLKRVVQLRAHRRQSVRRRTSRPVLQDVDLRIEPNQMIANRRRHWRREKHAFEFGCRAFTIQLPARSRSIGRKRPARSKRSLCAHKSASCFKTRFYFDNNSRKHCLRPIGRHRRRNR